MSASREHPHIRKLGELLANGGIARREFLRFSTLLGLSAAAAYTMVGLPAGIGVSSARAQEKPRGGTVRISMRVQQVENPHAFTWLMDSNIGRQVCEYLTKTGQDNITRPYLAESWDVSDDLRTWDFHLRKDVKWRNGRAFVADDVIWNLNRMLDPATGSSMVGLVKDYMLEEFDTGKTDETGNKVMSVRLWDANAIEKVDDHTVRLNIKAPQLALPEHLFHFPAIIVDPEDGGVFGVGSNGTGPFELVEHEVGVKAVLKGRTDYWGEGPYLDTLEFVDLGDDQMTQVNALASKQVDGLFELDVMLSDALDGLPHLQRYEVATAHTGVARVKVAEKPFDDPRVRQALRRAIDQEQILAVAHRNVGLPAEHHHVCPIHPEYAKLPPYTRDVEEAKRLLAEAGHPNGLDLEIACKRSPPWEATAVQALVGQWAEAGIRVKINLMPASLFWDVWTQVPFSFLEWNHRPLGTMILGLAYRSGVPWNDSGYANPEFDRLLTEADGTLDVEARRAIMEKLERIMQEDGPMVQPLWRGQITYYDQRVKGFMLHPTLYIFGEELAVEAA